MTATTTQVSEFRVNAEKTFTILKSMSGEVNVWMETGNSLGRKYLSIKPETNMESVEMTFYTQNVRQYKFEGTDDVLEQTEFDDLGAAFKKSRKWITHTHA